jgi:hypothetical protein
VVRAGSAAAKLRRCLSRVKVYHDGPVHVPNLPRTSVISVPWTINTMSPMQWRIKNDFQINPSPRNHDTVQETAQNEDISPSSFQFCKFYVLSTTFGEPNFSDLD